MKRITVILPVFNGESYVAEAIESVLAQTFTDFELLLVDDGSTDQTPEVLKRYSDPRIRMIRFPENRGLVTALNTGIAQSSSDLIARMDADDICLTHRFARQVQFLDAHPEVGLCGTWTRGFGDDDTPLRPPVKAVDIRTRLFWGWAMDHPSIMMRRRLLEEHSLAYDERYRHVEDFDFFIRAAEVTQLANLPEFLQLARAHPGEVSVIHRQEQLATEGQILLRQLHALMPQATEDEKRLHQLITRDAVEPDRLPEAEKWLLRLDEANRRIGRYDRAAFWRQLTWKWCGLHASAKTRSIRLLPGFARSKLAGFDRMTARRCAGLLVQHAKKKIKGWSPN